MQRGDRLITDKKITAADYADKDVVSAPDRLTGTAQENKYVFDRAVKEVVQPKYNALIDELDTELASRIVSDDILKMRLDENGVVEYSADGTNYVKMIGRHGAKGDGTPATGAEIFNVPDNVASGSYSHAEGINTNASGRASHAEGSNTLASGYIYGFSHAEGSFTKATGDYSHAEGYMTDATEKGAHAEGFGTSATGEWSHAEGKISSASGVCSHAEGTSSARGDHAHAEGTSTSASGNASHSGGNHTIASAENQFAIGKFNEEDTNAAVIVGNGESEDARSNAMTLDWNGNLKLAGDVTFSGDRSLTDELSNLTAEDVGAAPAVHTHTADDISGLDPVATSGYVSVGRRDGTIVGAESTAEGKNTIASGKTAHAEGDSTEASGSYSHAEGKSTKATGYVVHAEGYDSEASGSYSHAEGKSTKAIDYAAHAEGNYSEASGNCSHAEGTETKAIGYAAHAEGSCTEARGDYSHARGYYTLTNSNCQSAIGKYNAEDITAALILGNGTSTSNRSNAMTVDWNGNLNLAGDITFSGNRSLTEELNNITIPIAGDELGGVKNGGNVVVNSDGTMTAPDAGAKLNRTDFTETDARWSALTDGRYTLTLSLEDQNPICVFRKDGDKYKLSVCDIESLNGTVSAISYDKFAGYLLTAEDGEGGGSSSGGVVRSINGVFPNGEGAVTLTASQVGAATNSHTHTYTQVGAAAASHTHSYTAITGLGSAATKNVGTGASNVAAGNHSHAASAIGISAISGMQATTVQEALEENFQSVASGKQLLETAISDGGGTVSKEDDVATFQELADGVDDILTKIVDRSFKTFTIPDGTQEIGTGAFYNCVNLHTVAIPASVTSIKSSAFAYCGSLTLNELPADLTNIGNNAFLYCRNLALTALPASLTSIGSNAFEGCDKLALTELPAGLTSINLSVFKYCAGLALTELPPGVTSIGTSAFEGCTSLALTELPDNLTLIGITSFKNCTSLALTELPSGLTDISFNAFNGCTGLTRLRLGNALKSIATNAFTDCTNLTQITCDFAQGAVSGAPWGATNANITYLR